MDDRRFRSLLRSVLALSLGTPAALAACRADSNEPFFTSSLDAGKLEDATLEDATLPPINPVAIDATACVVERGVSPPPGFDGGAWQSTGCGAAILADNTRTCVRYHQFPCCEDPRMPTPGAEPIEYPLDVCRAHCEDTPDRPLKRCEGRREILNAPGSSPVLVCDYTSDTSACGCVDLYRTRPDHCGWEAPLPCGLLPPETPVGVGLDAGVCVALCNRDYPQPQATRCETTRGGGSYGAPERGLHIACAADPVCFGRPPAGLTEVAPATGSVVGAWLAEAARMEAASCTSFAVLREELLAHDAPCELVERARRAEADEVRHATMTAKLARRLGAREGAWSAPPIVETPAHRDLEAIAIENAVEGCVNETFAALLAMWQAEHAKDKGLRRAMASIAEDEVRHAALAWSVAEWSRAKLSPAGQRRVDRAFEAAFARLEAMPVPDPALVDAGILPPEEQARALVHVLRDALSA